MSAFDVVIRPLAATSDHLACVSLQQATWGRRFRELVPPALLMIAEKLGGVAAGAFDDTGLVGFVYGLTGLREGRLAHWSHMLAVAADWRDRGVGRRLKAYQRARVLAAGVEHMVWTFDPLVARNAHLNLNRLGVRVIEYVRQLYGDDPDSTTDAVIGSDRVIVEWDLTAAGPPDRRTAGDSVTTEAVGAVVSRESPAFPDAAAVEVAIPGDIQQLKERAPSDAEAWRAVTRAAFEHYLARGYQVRGFRSEPGRTRSYYRLERVVP